MPLIHVKSLPFRNEPDIQDVVEGLSMDFATAMDIAPEHVSVTWEYLAPGAYAIAGKAGESQVEDSYPVLVDLLAPDFTGKAQINLMLEVIASSISNRVGVSVTNVFVNYREAHAGRVFDRGQIVTW